MREQLILSILTIVTIVDSTAGDYIEVSNNGPVTVDTPITFTVSNSYRTIAPSFEYRFKFESFPEKDMVLISSSDTVNLPVTFNSLPKIKSNKRLFSVEVDVWYRFLRHPVYSIGSVVASFDLSESLIGEIEYDQVLPLEDKGKGFISTELPVNLTAKIHDPSGFFNSANITYKWILNGSPLEESSQQTISSNFTSPQMNNISVIVSAKCDNPTTHQPMDKSGSFEISLKGEEPIHNLAADGHTNVELFRDESLQLTLKIDGGTPPFYYCWDIADAPANATAPQRVCYSTNESFFMITRYFDERGKKTLLISVNNHVSKINKNMTILIYEIEHSTQLSFILIPVCSIIIAIFIIIAGVAIHMRQRKELTIEVADFDFQSYDELSERTFFERIRDNFTQYLRSSIFRPCTSRPEYDHFADKVDSDDIAAEASGEPSIGECNLRFTGDLDDSGVSGDVRT